MPNKNKLPKDKHFLSKFHADGVPPASCGASQIEVTFDINAQEVLNGSAKDTSTGNPNPISIMNGRMLPAENDLMAQNAEKYGDVDEVNTAAAQLNASTQQP